MKRHGDDKIAFRNHGSSDALQPTCEARHEIETIGMLERQDCAFAGIVIPHDCARLVVARRLSVARGAFRLVEHGHVEWQSTDRASRTLDETDCAPAPRAKAARITDMLAALQAQGWKKKVEEPMPGPAQSTRAQR